MVPTSFAYKTTFYTGSYESIYVTDGSALIAQSNKSIRTGDQLVWNTFVNLVGTKFVDTNISEFRVYNNSNSDVSAFVEEKPDGSWIVAVNREGSTLSEIYNKKPMIDLLLHEYGHIVFFNDDGDIERDFKNTFWKGVSSRTYTTKEFVTEYAVTNAQEDMIESFVYFVTTNKPTDTLKKSNKIRFFYEYPELVSLRSSLQKSDLF